jgi:preprotein translocase subunit SecA
VSIGLEAYAQRDPLVQYKGRASEMFQELLADIRSLVISRVFASRPRRIQLTLTDTSENPEPVQVQPKGQTQSDGKKKKKRRRHKK